MRVKDICILQNGRAFKPDDWSPNGIPIVRIQNLNDENAPFNYFQGEYDSVHEVNDGELLFSWSGTPGTSFGAFRWNRGKGVLNQHIFKVIPKIDVDKEYLRYAFNGNLNAIISKAHGGVGLQHITKKELDEIEIPIVSLADQHEIVSILHSVEKILANRQFELAKLDDLIKARFVELFGDPVLNEKRWKTKPLLDMGTCKNGMNFHYDDSGVEINCLGVGDFKDYSVIENTDLLPIISLNEMPSEEYLLKDEDIVFVRSNGNKALVGRSVAVYPGDVKTTFSGFCIRYRKHDSEITVPYLLRVLKADSVRMKMAGRGANIQNLNQQILSTLVIPVPPVELQNQFSDFVGQVDKSKSVVQKSLEETQLLFDSLMQIFFG